MKEQLTMEWGVPAWIYVPVEDDRLASYREFLYEHVDAPDTYQEVRDSHITIHPGFMATPDAIEALQAYLTNLTTMPAARATAIYAYPNLDHPLVIALAIAIDLTEIRENINHLLTAYDATIFQDPTPPHLTMLRAQGDGILDDSWTGPPEQAHERLTGAVADLTVPSGELEIGAPIMDFYNPESVIDE